MLRTFVLILLLWLACDLPCSWAGQGQYANSTRQTLWNDLTDKIHTFGQKPAQARLTKTHLHYLRLQARLKSIANAQNVRLRKRYSN